MAMSGYPLKVLPVTSIGREAEERGHAIVEGIVDQGALLEWSKTLGTPLKSADGYLMKELRVTPSESARPRTFSASFGTDAFPLHTDTAFWPMPARFLVMRAIGDNRRPTTICSLDELLSVAGATLSTSLRRSVWILRTMSRSVYCQMTFLRPDLRLGFRFDRQCMLPANSAAREIDEYIRIGLPRTAVKQISWSGEAAVVVANWQSLHGRGPEPSEERERIIQRIYVG